MYKKLVYLVGEVYITVKILDGVYRLGEKVGEAKAYYELGKKVSNVTKELKDEESK